MLVALGWLAGLSVAAPPVGPLTLLFYRHVMVREFRAAAAVAAVIALADGVYAAISMFGLSWVAAAPAGLVLLVRLVGVVLIAMLGARYAFFPPQFEVSLDAPNAGTARMAGAQAAGIAALNPSALISWMLVVDVLRTSVGTSTPTEQALLPLAVTCGVATWYTGVLLAWRNWIQAPSPLLARAVVRVVGLVLITTAAAYGWQATLTGGLDFIQQARAHAP